jgi:hypothetical protein
MQGRGIDGSTALKTMIEWLANHGATILIFVAGATAAPLASLQISLEQLISVGRSGN